MLTALCLTLSLAVSAPTAEAALAQIVPASSRELVDRVRLPGLPRPGPEVDFIATPAPGSSPEVVVAELVARHRGRVVYARRVTIPVRTTLRVPVPRRTIDRGHVLRRSDFEITEAHVPSPKLVVTDLQALLGCEVRRPLAAGHPVPRRSVDSEKLVKRGDMVKVTVAAGGFRVVMEGRALEPGAKGEVVRVVNGQSNQIVEAHVVGARTLEVRP